MTEIVTHTPRVELDSHVEDVLASDYRDRQSQAWVDLIKLDQKREQSLRQLESQLELGQPVLVINQRPARRAEEHETLIQEMFVGTLSGDRLQAGTTPATITLPVNTYQQVGTRMIGGRDRQAVMENRLSTHEGPIPLIVSQAEEMRFPGHDQDVLVGDSEIARWFNAHASEAQAYLMFCRMYYASTGKPFQTKYHNLARIRREEVERLWRVEKRLDNPHPDWDDQDIEDMRVEINASLVAFGDRPSPLEKQVATASELI